MDLSKYKNALGVPGTGIHSFRIFNIAIADVLLTILAAYIISYFSKQNFKNTLIVLFILGIILHKIFSVNTTVGKIVFGS